MKFNNKKLEKTSRLINFIISSVLCGFLILLSSQLIGDVDDWKEPPTLESFQNIELLNENDSLIALIEADISMIQEKMNRIVTTINVTESNYSNAK